MKCPDVQKPSCNSFFVRFDRIAIRWREDLLFRGANWQWNRGEQWAIVGPNASGKSLLGLALAGQAPVVRGEMELGFGEAFSEDSVAILSPYVQREMILGESSFYQSRWHTSLGEGHHTVAQFLSQDSVEQINPFEVGGRKGNPKLFLENRKRFVQWLALAPLMRRKIIHLSNGEQRKALLAYTLLRQPRLLVLDDPFGGLDIATRERLRTVIARLMRNSLPTLVITSRIDEIPQATTHLLLVKNHKLVASGPKKAVLRHPLIQELANTTAIKLPRRAIHQTRRLKSSEPLVELDSVTIQRGRKRILDHVSWTVRQHEHWALLGPNGSGKTTLLSLIQGDNPAAYGLNIRLFGARPDSTQTLWQARQRIGWLSPELHQHYPTGWTCLEVVCSGFTNSIGLHQTTTVRQRSTARRWLDRLGFRAANDLPLGDLSLAEQRLVLLARSIVKNPELLILDEPCQGLDVQHRQTVIETVDQLIAETGATLIFVTHHPKEMPACIQHVLRLQAGAVLP